MGVFKKSRLAEIERIEKASRAHGILLVDDERDNLQTLSFPFRRHYEVFAARDGEQALDMMQDPAMSGRIQLVLSDQRMPRLSGVELFERLREISPDVIRILITGYADMQATIDSINKAHIYQYLFKPVDTEELLVLVKRALEAYDMRKKLDLYHLELENLVKQRTLELEEANEGLRTANRGLEVAGEELRIEHQRLVRAQRQLVLQEKMAFLGALTAGVAHELRNPLNFVINFAESMTYTTADMLERPPSSAIMNSMFDETTGETIRDVIGRLQVSAERVLSNGHRANEIIKTMTKISNHKVLPKEPTDLSRLLTKYMDLAYTSMQAQLSDIEIVFDKVICDDLDQISLSEASFGRVLAIMFTNSFEAIMAKHQQHRRDFAPRIRWEIRQQDESVELVIWDNGMGIPARAAPQIFHPFFTTKANHKNIGLGLSIAYDIVTQEYGGEIEVSAEAGEYAEFVIRLPRSSGG